MAVLACVAAGCIAASAYLTFATLRSAQQEAFDARFALAAQRAATAAERALALGVALTDQPPLQALLEREATLEPAIVAFGIASASGQRLLGHTRPPDGTRATTLLERPVRNDLGQTLARVRIAETLFDRILHLTAGEHKSDFVTPRSIFIDNHFPERADVAGRCGVPVFDVDALAFLIR